MQITPAPPQPRSDLTIVQAVLPCQVMLAPNARLVRTGTPLVIDQGAWRAARVDETPWMFAMNPGYGGDKIDACKSMIVDTHVLTLVPGRVRILDIDDTGVVQFINDPAGTYLALTRSRVLLG